MNNLKLRTLKITKSACLTMVASACEVYPKECMGALCCQKSPNGSVKVTAAFPFQIAARKITGVDSTSYEFFQNMLSRGPWKMLCDYHSHTLNSVCEPSNTDLEVLCEGDLEVIIMVNKRKKVKKNKWLEIRTGKISISWDLYQFQIGAFVYKRPIKLSLI